MQNFLDRFKPKKDGKSSSNVDGNKSNGLGDLFNGFGGNKKFSGEGKSLGGSTQPGIVIPVQLSDPGPLGMAIEKRPMSGTAIVGKVIPGSQADRAGIQRGDILCFAGSNGKEEILHEMFVELAKESNHRPLCFEVRRIETVAAKKQATATAAADANMSAEAFARKQAMIAAAEAREKKFKQATKPVKTGFVPKPATTPISSDNQSEGDVQSILELSEAGKQAMQAAKEKEMRTVMELGYNPYEANTVTAGQARNAVTITSHGTILNNSSTEQSALINSTPVTNIVNASPQPPSEFGQAFETMITTNIKNTENQVKNSLSILCKLITNATTKSEEKFRKVRLSNPKIQAAIVDVHGALDIMLLVGFQLSTEDETGESILLYIPPPVELSWLPQAIEQMERYCKS